MKFFIKNPWSLFLAAIVAIACMQIIGCKKDDHSNLPIDPGISENVPAPIFSLVDSIILLAENQTTFSIEIVFIDTLDYYYTIDGSLPGRNTSKYDPETGILIGEGTFTIKAIAYSGICASEVSERRFIVTHLLPVVVSGIINRTNYNNPVNISISNINSAVQYISKLNSVIVDLSSPYNVSEPNFYSLKIVGTLGSYQRADSFLFVIMDPDLNETEWGLKTWVPAPFTADQIGSETIEVIYPQNFVTGLNLPVILKTIEAGTIKPLYLYASNSLNSNTFNIKRGIGSVNLFLEDPISSINIHCGNKNIPLSIVCEDIDWTVLSGTVNSYNTGKNARIHIDGNMTIPSGDTLLIDEGSIVAVDEAVDINNYGCIKIEGSSEYPVVITCYNPEGFWGGFLSKGAGNSMEVSNAILCQSGYHSSVAYQWGHAKRQALFYLENSNFNISESYLLDHVGQVFYSTDAILDINNVLVQRVKTGGQLNTSQVQIENSIFTDFPNDSYAFQDDDNDALYISHCDATVSNSTFMFAKDDGIDSGNDEGGIVNIDNCWFEANFHEGIALSSKNPAVRTHNISNCTVTNCGQGIELGFSSPYHTVNIDKCLLFKNGIGLRYGDNYDWSIVDGFMKISNTQSIDNLDKDVWNMVRQQWGPKLDHMIFTNTYISKPSEQYPELPIL